MVLKNYELVIIACIKPISGMDASLRFRLAANLIEGINGGIVNLFYIQSPK